MADIPGDDIKARASELVRTAVNHASDQVSRAERGALVDAVEQDLRTASEAAIIDAERLARVETQTRVLAEAVLAITKTADHDLRAVAADAATAEERLVKVEAQTRVLAEAVIAITDTTDKLAPAVKAVKDEM